MLKTIVYIACIILFIIGYVKYIETHSLYFPAKDIDFTPKDVGLSFEDVYIKTQDDVQINGWFIYADDAQYTMLFCHGNAGNIGHRLDKIILMNKMKLNIFIIDYRGYGRSQGRPNEEGIYLDAQAAYEYLVDTRKIRPEQIILYGESLGCAAAINIAAEKKIRALIAEGAFTRGRDVAKQLYPFLPAFLFSNSFNSLEKMAKIDAPKLFLHSQDDEIINFRLAQRLYELAREPKVFAKLSGGHNDAFQVSQDKYTSSIASFINQLKP